MGMSFAAFATLACLTARLSAQDTLPYPAGSNLVVRVDGRVTAQVGNRVWLDYKVTNLATSQQSAWEVLLKAGLPFSGYELQGPLGWRASKGLVQDSSVVHWSAFEDTKFIAPGAARASLKVTANGVLDIVPAWVQGFITLPDADEDHVLAPPPTFFANSASTFTIAHVPIPVGGTVGSLVTRLRGLVDQSCGSLGWITSSPMCNTLVNLLIGSPVQLTAFRDSLSANRGAGVSLTDNPYYLLLSNRDYIRSLITSSSFTLLYVCGNRFTVRNRVNVALPASYTVNNTLETGSLVLTAKPVGAEWSLTDFTVTNQGTVRLLYDGTVYGTLTPTYTTCP